MNLVSKSKLSHRSGCLALRELNPIHQKGARKLKGEISMREEIPEK